MYVGCAGWAVPANVAERFPGPGTHLQRFARVLGGAEINTSFYRPHRRSTYVKWAESAPAGFRFAVKVPKEITHVRRLGAAGDVEEVLERFLEETGGLEEKLGPLLIQLPPSLALAPVVAERWFEMLRGRFAGAVVCEPRHASWFGEEGERLLVRWKVARVAADPAVVAGAGAPGGWGGLVYFRLHGSPQIYHSAYSPERIVEIAETLVRRAEEGKDAWCIFDNTASGAAASDALGVIDRVRARGLARTG